MKSKIVFSVIIDSFNYGLYIENAIRSAQNQTLSRELYEIILVDDGSTDDTRQRVAKYPDIIYLYKENGGQASAFNAGLEIANGEFVAFLDADDYWASDKLARVLDLFKRDGSIDVVYHTLHVVDGDGFRRAVMPAWFDKLSENIPIENDERSMTLLGCVTSGIAWRVETLKTLLPIPLDYRICADGYLMFCASLVVRKYALIDTPLGFYRIHGGNGYAALNADASASHLKSTELAAFYRRLFLEHMRQLSERLERRVSGVLKELNVVCFADELMKMQKSNGTVKALSMLWQRRSLFPELSLRYRYYRFTLIMFQLFLPAGFYLKLQKFYLSSSLWLFVQSFIKNNVSDNGKKNVAAPTTSNALTVYCNFKRDLPRADILRDTVEEGNRLEDYRDPYSLRGLQ